MPKQSIRKRAVARKPAAISAAGFDAKADAGEDISAHLDPSTARVVEPAMQKVNVDFPEWVVSGLDAEATRIAIPRQSLIKVWIVERLERAQPG